MQSYEKLKKIISEQSNINNEQLERLKEQFAAEINTPRRRSCIRSVADLLVFLERCDVLSEQNIHVLSAVADISNSRQLHKCISDYMPPKNDLSVLAPHINQYAVHRLDSGTINSQHVLVSAETYKQVKPAQVPLTAAKVNDIHNMISHEIGNYWRRLARELELSEAVMDEIEILFARDLSSRTMKVLQMHMERCNNLDTHIKILTKALAACQRRDLKRRMENMLTC